MSKPPCLRPRHSAGGRKLRIEPLESRELLTVNWEVTFLDGFDADTTANYTRVAPLARPGSVLPDLDVSGGALTLTGSGQVGEVTQSITFHNTATLGVGETVLLDIDLVGGHFGAGNEMLGLVVSAGIMTGVDPIPPTSNLDLRDDEHSFLLGGFRSAGLGDDYRSDGFIAVDQGQISGGEQSVDQSSLTGGDLSLIASLYVTRTGDSAYEMGWIDDSGDLHSVRTVNVDLGASPSIGIFTDMRQSTFSQTVDNLRIAHEEAAASYPENPVRFARQVEDLDRGVVAVRRSSSQVYLGWRMLGTDPQDIAFNLYRFGGGGGPLGLPTVSVPGVKINGAPITQTTDFIDTPPSFSTDLIYYVVPVIDGVEQEVFDSFTLPANAPVQQYLNVPLQIPPAGVTPIGENYTYTANDASVGDLDGDGDYEIILKWEPSNKTNNSADGYTGNTFVDAYSLEGQLLWRIDLGVNIRSGPHTTQFLVYDFDGDGRSEVVMKTVPGTVDGMGQDVVLPGDDPNADYRETSGFLQGIVVSGPEYLTVFDGLTGGELSTIEFPLELQSVNTWGDNYANRSDRFMAAVAYLDGVRPSIVWTRGIYGPASGYTARNEQVALDWRDGQLTERWRFNAVSGGANSEYVGEGGQSLSVADVDGDGFDEIIYGAAVVDHDGTLLYATGWGHGDALHVSDMVPSNPGLEIFMPHESASSNGNIGASLRDGATGQLLFSIYGEGDIGRGVAADIDPNHAGYEYWIVTGDPAPGGGPAYNYTAQNGEDYLYQTPSNMFTNFVVWWDADLTRELLNSTTISEWNNPGRSNFDLDPSTGGLQQFAPNASSNNDSKQTPVLSADILGDWREEVIWRRSDNTALEIFTTIIPANNRLYTLMHDTQYREAIAWQNVGYNQPPHPSFFLGEGMQAPPTPVIYLGGELSGDYNADGLVDAADYSVYRDNLGSQQNLAADGNHNGVVDQADYLVWRNNYGAVALPPASFAATLSAEHTTRARVTEEPVGASPDEGSAALEQLVAAVGEDADSPEAPAAALLVDAAIAAMHGDSLLLLIELAGADSTDAEEASKSPMRDYDSREEPASDMAWEDSLGYAWGEF